MVGAPSSGASCEPGTFGENLTVEGIDLGALVIGTRWQVGTTVLEVSQPRQPCFKLGIRMGDAEFVDRFDAAARFGAYFRIVHEGDVGAGDEIDVVAPRRRHHGAGARDRAARRRRAFLERVVADAAVALVWRDWARRRLARQ